MAQYLQVMWQVLLGRLSKEEPKAAQVAPQQCLVIARQDSTAFIAVFWEVAVAKASQGFANIQHRLQDTQAHSLADRWASVSKSCRTMDDCGASFAPIHSETDTDMIVTTT